MTNSKHPNLYKKAADFIHFLEEQGGEPLYKMKPEKAREFLKELQRKSHKEIPADICDTQIFTPTVGNVDIRVVRPPGNNEKLPAVIYFHGGGWILGDKETHDMLLRRLAVWSNCTVIFPTFTPSPDVHYPASFDECYAVVDYIYNNPDGFNINSEKIAVAGDSAGGNLATAVAIRAQKEHGPKIVFQALFYPVTDAEMKTESYKEFKDGPWLTKKAMEWFWDAYCPDKDRRHESCISPLKAKLEELQGLPPTLIITAENDVLRDEGEAYAKKLDDAGVEVVNARINGVTHDFMMLNEVFDTMPTKGAFALAAKLLRHFLHH